MKRALSNVSCKFGAPLGRPNIIPADRLIGKLYLGKLKWVDWDYDEGGAYWGCTGRGLNMYRATGETATNPIEPVEIFVRALNRKEAKEKVTDILQVTAKRTPKFFR
jgi:hypothetical protein